MFDLRFVSGAEGDVNAGRGLITLGDHTQGFVAPLDLWSRRQYEAQWIAAACRLLEGQECTAFFTSVSDPAVVEYQRWWPVWREDKRLYVQEHLLKLELLDPPFDLSDPYVHIHERQQISEGGHRIAEWRLRLADMAAFVERHPEYHASA